MAHQALPASWNFPDIEFVHLNEIGGDGVTSAHLLYFDSVHGRWNREVRGDADKLVIDGKTVTHSSQKNFADVPWREMGVDIVLESSGKFRTQEQLEVYLKAPSTCRAPHRYCNRWRKIKIVSATEARHMDRERNI